MLFLYYNYGPEIIWFSNEMDNNLIINTDVLAMN
jgi:hypothetical protein